MMFLRKAGQLVFIIQTRANSRCDVPRRPEPYNHAAEHSRVSGNCPPASVSVSGSGSGSGSGSNFSPRVRGPAKFPDSTLQDHQLPNLSNAIHWRRRTGTQARKQGEDHLRRCGEDRIPRIPARA